MNCTCSNRIGGCFTSYALEMQRILYPGLGKTISLPIPDFFTTLPDLEIEPETRKCGNCVTKQCCIICGKCDGCDC